MKIKSSILTVVLSVVFGLNSIAQTDSANLSAMVKEFNTAYPAELKKLKNAVHLGSNLKPEEFTDSYKQLLFNIYMGFNEKIAKAKSVESVAKKDKDTVFFFKSVLEKLEYKETEVDRASEELQAHYVYLEARKFNWKKRAFVDFVSWQTEATLKGPASNTSLLANNLGYQFGLGLTYENSFWSYGAELSGLYGYGGVSNISGSPYQQSSVPAYGAKFSLAGARVVSSTGSVLGVRCSGMYLQQTLTTPSLAGYSIQQNKALNFTASLFTQWRFDRYYFESDFGRYIAKPSTIWSLGLGVLF